MVDARADGIIQTWIAGSLRNNLSVGQGASLNLAREMIREVLVACSWEADDDHTTSVSEKGISLDLGPQLGFPDRYFQCVWVFRITERGLDALGIICRRYRWFVAPICCKRLSHGVGWLCVQLNKGFLQIPRELLVKIGVLLVDLYIFNPGCRPHAVVPLFALKPGGPLARIG